MKNLVFRAPGETLALADLLARARPGAHRGQIEKFISRGDVRVEGKVIRSSTASVTPGALVQAVVAGQAAPTWDRAPMIVHRTEHFVVVDKPSGIPSHPAEPGAPSAIDLVADEIGIEADRLWPVHRLDAEVSGAWLIALDRDAAAELSGCFARGEVRKEYRALVPAMPWPDGTFDGRLDAKRARTSYQELRRQGETAELRLHLETGRKHQLRRHLASADAPILGDSLYGGVMVAGGLRLRSTRLALDRFGIDVELVCGSEWWPNERVFAWPSKRTSLTVSEATRQALDRGHPWVLTDTETSDAGMFRPGAIVQLRTPVGKTFGQARIEGAGKIAARAWSSEKGKVRRALTARRPIAPLTNALRLVHGEADGLPGLFVDRYGDVLRVLVTGRSALALVERTVDRVIEELQPDTWEPKAVVLVTHLAEMPSGHHRRVRIVRGNLQQSRVEVREGTLRFWADMGLDEPFRSTPATGFFLDQRANRARVAELAEGGRWLNLFAHTGAFSVTALASGAREVTSVDLSGRYLGWLDENLQLNGLDDGRHSSVKQDVRRFLARLEPGDGFDGIILDPPTAAAAGKRFWSIRKEGAELVGTCLSLLTPGGHVLVCRNDRRGRGRLEALVREVASDLGLRVSVQDAPADVDFPTLEGFPEGDPFEAVWVTRARPKGR